MYGQNVAGGVAHVVWQWHGENRSHEISFTGLSIMTSLCPDMVSPLIGQLLGVDGISEFLSCSLQLGRVVCHILRIVRAGKPRAASGILQLYLLGQPAKGFSQLAVPSNDS